MLSHVYQVFCICLLSSIKQFISLFCNLSIGPLGSNDGNSWKDASEGHSSLPHSLFSELSEFPSYFISVVFQIATSGTRSKDYFDRHGDLKRIRRLKFWPLDCLLVERYNFTETDARGFADFLRPILDFTPENRPSAAQCLKHPWLNWSDEMRKSNQQKFIHTKYARDRGLVVTRTADIQKFFFGAAWWGMTLQLLSSWYQVFWCIRCSTGVFEVQN